MSPLETARLAAWREVHARGPVLLLCWFMAVGGLAIPDRFDQGWYVFLLVVILPAVLVVLATKGPAKADGFWRGLGGPGWARLLGAAAVHGGGLLPALVWARVAAEDKLDGAALGVLARQLSGLGEGALGVELPGLGIGDLVGLLFLGTLYALASLGRAAGGPVTAWAAVVVGAAGFGGATWLHVQRPGPLSPVDVPVLEAALLLGLAVVGAVLAEQRLGAWGAAVRRGRVTVPLAALGGGALVLVAGGFAWPDRWLGHGVEVVDVAADGRVALLRYPSWRDQRSEGGPMEPSTPATLWIVGGDQAPQAAAAGPIHDVALGPEGAAAWEDPGLGTADWRRTMTLVRGEERIDCTHDSDANTWLPTRRLGRGTGWRADGGALALVGNDDRIYVLDLERGCRTEPRRGATHVGWLVETLVRVQTTATEVGPESEVRVGDRFLGSLEGCATPVEAGGSLFVAQGPCWTRHDGKQARFIGGGVGPVGLWRVEADRLVEVFTAEGEAGWPLGGRDMVCLPWSAGEDPKTHQCWDSLGRDLGRVEAARFLPPGAAPELRPGGLVQDHADGGMHLPLEGRRLPGALDEEAGGTVLLVGEGEDRAVRQVTTTGFVDHRLDGTTTETTWCGGCHAVGDEG